MTKEVNHTCAVCGIKYYACDSCNEAKRINPWQVICESENHYKIHLVIRDYVAGNISKKVAKSQLKRCDLSDMSTYRQGTLHVLEEILKEQEKPVQRVARKKVAKINVEKVDECLISE